YTCSAGSRGITLINTNPELSQPGCIGIKSGADSEKEHSVITAYVEGTARLAAIILEAPSESSAYSIAFRLITEGFSRYISEGGLRSFTPTDALFVSKSSARLLDRPGGAADIMLKEGETLRVCGSSREGGSVWYCVYLRGSCFWVSSSEVDFVCYVDDIFIENGESLSCEMDKGGNIEIASYASSRHLINSVRLTVSLPDGSVALTSEHFPNTRGVCRLDGTSFSAPFEASASLREGVYLCTIEVTATAYADGLEPQSIIKTNSSILAVETGGECVSYNANVGVDQPEGECFFDRFTVTSDTPSRAGYKFICWNTQPDGSGENYFPGSEIVSDGSITLYAVWEKGPDRWEVNARILYEDSLIVEGFVRDLAGITNLRMRITGKDGTIYDEAVDYYGNTAELGSLFIKEPICLEEGEYTVEILGSAAGGAEVDLISQEITVNDPGSGPHEDPSESAAPDENASQAPGSGFSLLNIPIWVWFIVGAVVFFGLIALIIIIIKRG
ncbi:MAG: InlB B-repeat-containing protein, partial [Clostridia bacterium]|nr:InlB B-repeat-containing protein [Clostridia bacterium]